MRTNAWRKTSSRRRESGQAMLFIVLALGLFLLGAVAFAVDMGWLWFHRQTAQNAADAACTAGAMDIIRDAQNEPTGKQGFTLGTPFLCSGSPTASPCIYAALNGYDGKNTFPGNDIRVTFPARTSPPPGVTAPPIAIGGTYPFMRVDVTDHAKTFFFGLLSGKGTVDVRAGAVCGVVLAQSPIPILVLDTQSPKTTPPQASLNIFGTATIAIVGGPSQSIQVDSGAYAGTCGQSNCSVNLPWGSAKIDLSKGGPQQTGSDIGLTGAPSAPPGGFIPGTTGHWNAPSSPIPDPFSQVCAPGQIGCPQINGNSPPPVPPAAVPPADAPVAGCAAIPCVVAYKAHGCPDTNGCYLYTHGLYTSGICVGNSCTLKSKTTAIFDPGLYYITGGLALKSGSLVRPGTGVGDGSGGTTFYFSGSGTVTVAANAGTSIIDPFNSVTGTGYSGPTSYPNGVGCTPVSKIPSNLGGGGINLQGNILLGACSGYYGDPAGINDPLGEQHGFLFFQDRSAQSVGPSWGGGGQFLLAGSMYFHSCNASGTGLSCGAPTTWLNDDFTLSGNSGSGTYVLGDIITDNLSLGGTSGITMDLNPQAAYNVLKASLLQ